MTPGASADPVSAYLGLGSNIGDRFGHLNRAIQGLEAGGLEVEAISAGYETEPVGEILDQPDFLNAAVRVKTRLEPVQLLDLLKSTEAEMGREAGLPRHSPRIIDIDLLLYGDLEFENERLRLPHREVGNRRFVLVPLLELDPDLATPAGERLDGFLAALPAGQDVRLAGPLRD